MDNKMQTSTENNEKSYMQLRMGLLGAATAMLLCFGAAIAFAGVPAQPVQAEAAAAKN